MQFKAAVVQAASIPFDRDKTVDKACDLIARAAEQGARLIVFPEMFVSGYPKGCQFGAAVGYRRPEGRDDYVMYHAGAIDVPGPHTERLAEAARDAQAHVVMGVLERGEQTLYCTVLFFGPDGSLMGKHRKLMPTAAERLVWGYGDGSTMPVFDTDIGALGAVICWENYMPAMRLAMYGKGIAMYCAPTADDRETWVSTMQHVAMEGGCFVFSACQYITRGAYADDYRCDLGDDPDTVLMHGRSVIVNPMGEIIAGPNTEGETILYADIDPTLITKRKYDFDATGHYSRPDVFSLTVNERPMPAVRYDGK